jgi:hypothetical protein
MLNGLVLLELATVVEQEHTRDAATSRHATRAHPERGVGLFDRFRRMIRRPSKSFSAEGRSGAVGAHPMKMTSCDDTIDPMTSRVQRPASDDERATIEAAVGGDEAAFRDLVEP